MADDDLAEERARLEAVAWGAGSTPAEAARARVALDDLVAGRRPRRTSPTRARRSSRDGGVSETVQPRPGGDAGRPSPDRGSTPVHDPYGAGARTGTGARAVPDDAAATQAWSESAGSGPAGSGPSGTGPGEAAPLGPARPGPDGAAGGDHDEWGATSAPVGRGAGTGHDAGSAAAGGRGAGLQAGWGRRVRDLLTARRPRVWVALGAAAAVGVAFAAGTVVGTARPAVPAAPSITPTAGTVTLEQLLDVPQTYADQLPASVDAPVSLRSTRLVFTNRSLDGGDLETPWSVWAGVGTDRSTICLVATADRIESSTGCYPREDALHGAVSLSAQSASGTLEVWLRGGGVQGTVSDSY